MSNNRDRHVLRNRIVHDYEGVRLKIVWDTITQDFKPLLDQMRAIHDIMK